MGVIDEIVKTINWPVVTNEKKWVLDKNTRRALATPRTAKDAMGYQLWMAKNHNAVNPFKLVGNVVSDSVVGLIPVRNNMWNPLIMDKVVDYGFEKGFGKATRPSVGAGIGYARRYNTGRYGRKRRPYRRYKKSYKKYKYNVQTYQGKPRYSNSNGNTSRRYNKWRKKY